MIAATLATTIDGTTAMAPAHTGSDVSEDGNFSLDLAIYTQVNSMRIARRRAIDHGFEIGTVRITFAGRSSIRRSPTPPG